MAALLMTACASSMPSTDAGTSDAAVATGGGNATGGGTGGSGGTGGGGASTDAGPAEPTLSSAVLFRDDFDGYADLIALRASYPEIRELGGVIALEKDGGSGALRLDYSGDGGCTNTDVHVGKVLSGNMPTVIVTWKFRRPSGFTSCGDAGVEDFTLTRGATRTTFERSSAAFLLRAGTTEFVQHLKLDTHAPAMLADDAWHRVTLLLTRQSTPSTSDGVIQAWVDGALIIDLTGSTGTAPFSLATWPGALGNDTVQSRFVDELAISTP
ncbi:MAG: hypothetical protein QM817_39170 [Archangium sp.]